MAQDYLSKILDALQEAVFVLDGDRKVLSANPIAEELFGTGSVGNDFVQVIRHPEALKAVASVLAGAAQSHCILSTDAPINAVFQMNVADLGDGNSDGARIAVSLKDISDLREAEQMRTDFVANVSHELRSPLTALSGFIETLQTAAKDDPDARERFLGLMDMEAQRMVRLISDLLSLSKVESQHRQRPDGVADVAAIVERVKTILADQAIKEDKVIEVEVTGVVGSVPANEDELTQVFQNLIENALKYGHPNSTVTIKICEMERAPGISGPALEVIVNDEGDGIPQQHIARLTERFYRADTHRSRDKGGTGLGLAIVKHIINRHRGRLLISSKEGIGSTFSVYLPMVPLQR